MGLPNWGSRWVLPSGRKVTFFRSPRSQGQFNRTNGAQVTSINAQGRKSPLKHPRVAGRFLPIWTLLILSFTSFLEKHAAIFSQRGTGTFPPGCQGSGVSYQVPWKGGGVVQGSHLLVILPQRHRSPLWVRYSHHPHHPQDQSRERGHRGGACG